MQKKLQSGWIESHQVVKKKKKMKVELKLQHAVLVLEKQVVIWEESLKIMELQRVEKRRKTESPNVRLGVKRTINSPVSSPVTIKKLLPLKKMKMRENKRKPVGIKKADSKILTSTPCRKVIEENHEKKTIKRQKKSEIAKKIEVFKKEVAKKERDEKKEMVNKARAQPGKKNVKKAVRKKKVTQRSGRRPRKTKKIPDNPKL